MCRKLVFVFFIFLSVPFIFGILGQTQFVLASHDDENFSFSIDKVWYAQRDVIEVTGFINTDYGPEIQIEIINPNDLVIIQENVTLDEFPKIEHTIPTFGGEWNVAGFYQIRITYGDETRFVFFALGDFNPLEFEPQIFFDKDSYTWTETVKITVISPIDNQNANQVDEIKIQISSSVGDLSSYSLEESGNNNGIFSGTVTLTGHSGFDVDGDGRKGDALGNTGGNGPDEGFLAIYPNDEITVSFSTYYEETIKNTASIQFQKAQVDWISKTIDSAKKNFLRVIDPDMNLQSTIKNKVEVVVWSAHQSKVQYTLRETENNNGIFERQVNFVNGASDRGIFALEGSEIFLKYEDRTLPLRYSTQTLEVISKATIIDFPEQDGVIFETDEVDFGMEEEPKIEEFLPQDEIAPEIGVQIPDWIRNNAEWWAKGAIGDSDFVSGIQYLIKEGIMQIPETEQTTTTEGTEKIPLWIKNNAGWWALGLISDDDFVKGIQYLVEQGIIIV